MEEQFQAEAELLKALAHPVRLEIVCGLLCCGCRNVGCMAVHTGQSQSCISQHLAKLKAAGVVKAERSGNEVYYELAEPKVEALLKALLPAEYLNGTRRN
ncbi:MAG: metalloregulator ArsR/SmtB family transcription factor [Clostridiales bacterium]|nr:metalloregulator ArsR/SmtB family transcription factor [Clostridiales bacterium]